MFNELSGVNEDGTVNAVIEIPKDSQQKIEWDRKAGYFVLDRLEPAIFAKPVNYGFIPQTLDEDGDELDCLIVCQSPLPFGLVIRKAPVIGVLEFIDDGEPDHKIICTLPDNRDQPPPTNLEELGKSWRDQISHHFSHYKDLKSPGVAVVKGFSDAQRAQEIVAQCRQRALENKWW